MDNEAIRKRCKPYSEYLIAGPDCALFIANTVIMDTTMNHNRRVKCICTVTPYYCLIILMSCTQRRSISLQSSQQYNALKLANRTRR